MIAVEEVILFERCRPTLFQVFEWAVAPVLADRVGEGLAVAAGAVEVVGPRVLRAAVDQKGDRIFLPGV